MFTKESFLTQEVDEDTCGDCGHPAICHGRPFGSNNADVRCNERNCRCSHRNFIPKPIDTPAPTPLPNLKGRQAINRNRNLDRVVRAVHPFQRQRRSA